MVRQLRCRLHLRERILRFLHGAIPRADSNKPKCLFQGSPGNAWDPNTISGELQFAGQIHEANIEARTRERGAALSLSAKQDATNVRAKLAPTHSARANSSGGRVLKANGVHQVQDPKEQTELAANLPADSPVMGMRNWGVWRKQCAGRLACDLRPERPGSPWWSYTLGGADGSAIP